MKRLPLIVLLACFVVAAFAQNNRALEPIVPVAGPLKGQRIFDTSHALLIGINQYAHLPATRQLHFAVRDATAMREVLVQHDGFPAANVILLTDRQATRQAILTALSDFADRRRVGRDDRILVFLSGHG